MIVEVFIAQRHPNQSLRHQLGQPMLDPTQVEYLANPRYGLALSASMVALLTGVIPNLARLALSPIWGRLFDRINFFLLCIILNLGFALGILTFFTGNSMMGLVIGALVFGVLLAARRAVFEKRFM